MSDHFQITPVGVYLDGHQLSVADEVRVEHVAPDLHIVSLKLYVKSVEATEHHLVSETITTTYRYVQDKTGGQT